MTATIIAAITFACAFGCALVGSFLRDRLPPPHLSRESQDVVRLGMGLVATMTALILGLVTASAKATFDAEDQAIHTSADNVVMLDRLLAGYGPEAQPLRAEIRKALGRSISAIWGDQGATAANTEPAGPALQQGILALTPTTDAQRWQQSQALSISNDIAKARWLSITGTNSPIPVSFLVIITFWLSSLFWSFGLFAPRNATVIAVMLLSAASVSACVLLILEMQTPFSGILRISSGPLQFALEQLGK